MSTARHVGRSLAVLVAALGTTLAVAAPAMAHTPVFVTKANDTPTHGPLFEDGTISYAVYGVLDHAGATRGARTRLHRGDVLLVDLLLPNQTPEATLEGAARPTATVRMPDGHQRALQSTLHVKFLEPFSHTSYIRIAEWQSSAPADGVYEITVRAGSAPARFTMATGMREFVPGTVSNTVPQPQGGIGAVIAWYASSPPTTVVSSAPANQSLPTVPASNGPSPAERVHTGAPLAIIAVVVALFVGIGLLRARLRAARAPKP